ncbi:MAG: hypothetical protein KF768_13400 [Phycisphaeraceae bacterium]|nr:hypothetical protein [Phycisphaeraceae bacterium]
MVIEVVLGVLLGVMQHGLVGPLPRPCGRDFIKEHNDAVDRIPEDERLVPHLLRLHDSLKLDDATLEAKATLRELKPPSAGGDVEAWESARQVLADNPDIVGAIGLVHRVRIFGAYWSPDDVSKRPPDDRYFLVAHIRADFLGHSRDLSTVWRLVAWDCIERRDFERATEVICAGLRLAQVLGEEGLLIQRVVGIAIADIFLQVMLDAHASGSADFSKQQHDAVAAAINAFVSSPAMTFSFSEPATEDLLDRMYCDNGRHVEVATSAGKRLLYAFATEQLNTQEDVQRLQQAPNDVVPSIGLVVLASLAHRSAMYRQMERMDLAYAKLHSCTLANADVSDIQLLEQELSEDRFTYWPISIMFAAVQKVFVSREQLHQNAAATRLVMRLGEFRQARGGWPNSLADLDQERTASCIDRYTGKPLRFTRRDGRAIVYSTGPDRDDDGGHAKSLVNSRGQPTGRWIGTDPKDAPDGDWILWESEP